MSGSNAGNAPGVYGALGIAAAGNTPGARYDAVGWTDPSGNLWLFGGDGYDSSGTGGILNDLWEYAPSSGEWTWVSGSSTAGSSGSYGTQGTPSTSSSPGARIAAVTWVDGSGNFWLFGGQGNASAGTSGDLNDLWEFNPSAKNWTWVSGANTAVQPINVSGNGGSSYGTIGVPNTSNMPGGRGGAVSWIDHSGNLWLFGGFGHDSVGTYGNLNDLWEFSPSTKEWTWMSGSDTAGAAGVYGTVGTPSVSNVPGARNSAASWTDSSGNLWLFGGDSQQGSLQAWPNDLWEFNPTAKTWTWVSGSDTVGTNEGQDGVYGTLGTPAASNAPGGRNGAVAWIDGNGNLWLFGGFGFDSTGTHGDLNDLWRYQP